MKYIIAIVGVIIFALLVALPTMWLWNALIPVIFGLPVITFWQSLGLCLLCRGLFGTEISWKQN